MLEVQFDDTREVIREAGPDAVGTRVARVFSRDLALILRDPAASDLPVRGDAWSLGWPELALDDRTARPENGADAGPWAEIELTYKTPAFGGTSQPASQVPYADIDHQVTSVTQLSTLTLGAGGQPDEVGADSELIADGRGVPRDAGYIQITVNDFYQGYAQLAARLPLIIEIANANGLNRDTVSVPAYRQALGAGPTVFPAGQLRYHRFEPGDPDALGRFWVRHVLLAAADHDAKWTNEAPEGTSPVQRRGPIYPRYNFSGLW